MKRNPEAWERSALAALLHGFYNGVENAFKMLAASRGGVPSSPDWHSVLLQSMAAPAGSNRPVIERDLAFALEEYMRFRHFFRHAYVFDLNWEKMKPLTEELEGVFARFAAAVRAYLAAVPAS